ncbi:MAG: excinuclease ABC subunit UvrA [Nocardiopsis sp. BM-2018]|nr:MAG: excinuclease ABC subunit UvrA [Nocardiopsis sp. BM-2018]
MQDLVIRGAREHNLKDVDLTLPRNAFVVFTGVSGSGKSTLAFDTIYAEGQRRYVESLSAYARQFLGIMDKPDVDGIDGLSPAISIDQKTTSHNPRSTVGTVTEIHDYLRLLFARAGVPHCPECGRTIERQSASEIVARLIERFPGARAMLLAPVVRGRKGEYRKLFQELKKEGYARVRVDGTVQTLDEAMDANLERYERHDIEVVVDRVKIAEDDRSRLAESAELALAKGDGLMRVWLPDDGVDELSSERFACPEHGTFLEELEPRVFSFNSPYGACAQCSGLGFLQQFDPELIVPDRKRSIAQGAIAPWSGGRADGHKVFYWDRLRAIAEHFEVDLAAPWQDLPERFRHVVLHGTEEAIDVVYSRGGRETLRFKAEFEGVIANLQRRLKEAQTDYAREKLEAFMSLVACPSCEGTRYKPEVLAVTVSDRTIADVSNLSVVDARAFFGSLTLQGAAGEVARPILREVNARLGFLEDVGLDYLSLDRSANTLSGGEAQRIRLATQVGSGLTGVLYVLDEPSIGLHPRDNARLLKTLLSLRDLGNTLIVVEHDEETMRAADYIVDLGPGAGIHGGEVVAADVPERLLEHPTSLTAAYLRGDRRIEVPSERRKGNGKALTIVGAREHNLRDLTVGFPLGTLTCVTGASGSGKSTLVHRILHAALAKQLYRAKENPGAHTRITGTEHIDKVIEIDQSPIGRTPRSNPATYTGIFTEIRDLFTRAPESRKRGYKPGRFSFNVKGGRCEACKGDGTVKVEMYFLPDIYVPCEVCKGARYNRETLEVKIRAKSIADVLAMTVDEGLEFFEHIPTVARKLQLMKDVGLGYIRIGQPSPTLSGGEAQRVKLASELGKRSTGKTLYILDEPTTGLHFEDTRKLLDVLHRLVEAGNTLLVIEHNLDVIKTADWIVDLGPDGGARGGTLVAEGTPEQVALVETSSTGQYLRRLAAIAERLERLQVA